MSFVIAGFAFPKIGWPKTRNLVLGTSKIIIKKNSLIGTQVDRVIRDIAWKNSDFDEHVSPFRIPASREEVVPYMEGRMTRFLIDYAQVKVIGLTPAHALQRVGNYYASDGEGFFRFYIDPSKVKYKTAMFKGDKAVLPDTHGFNMVAGKAAVINEAEKIDLVIACMDIPAKAEAALYLAKKGINCFGPCDRFASELIGYKKKVPQEVTILGTAPIRKHPDGAVIGNQPVSIDLDEKIIVQYTDKKYPDQYCDTPARYFENLDKKLKLKLNLICVDAAVGETEKVVNEAKRLNARVIGIRILNIKDSVPVENWLKQDFRHRAILFHSAPYEPGYEMFFKFPEQTSFGDLNPIVV